MKVSVPFRGSCSEMAVLDDMFQNESFGFPSPFGVRVLKYLVKRFVRQEYFESFRPLSGFVF